jgi:hypothetical protein
VRTERERERGEKQDCIAFEALIYVFVVWSGGIVELGENNVSCSFNYNKNNQVND